MSTVCDEVEKLLPFESNDLICTFFCAGLQPLGGEEINSGYKGYGLAMMVELLTGVMGGGDSAHHIRKWNSFDKPANLGQMFVAVDPDRFCPVSHNIRLTQPRLSITRTI